MKRLFSHYFVTLMLTSLLVGFCGSMSEPVSAYVGEDIELNMYNDLDKHYEELYGKLLDESLRKFTETYNTKTKAIPACKALDGCIDTGKPFQSADLEIISRWNYGSVFSRLKKEIQLDTETIKKLESIASNLYQQTKTDVAANQKNLGEISLIGLYSDGSLDNSGFDLAYDLEQIHRIIFATEIPYNGFENGSARGMLDLLSGVFRDDTSEAPDATTSHTASGSSNTPGPTASGATNSGSSTQTSPILAGCDPTTLTNIDASLANDIRSQISGGDNNGSTTSGSDTQTKNNNAGSPGNNAPGARNWRNTPRDNKLTDTFPCNTFFCIRMNMVIYQQQLLGGIGKTNSIEKILDENFKIADKFAGNSLAATKQTRNFFQMSFKDLNLPSRVTLGVMVSYKPVPLLNVQGKPGEKLGKKSDEKPADILKRTFADQCLDYAQPNRLNVSAEEKKTAIGNSANLTTTEFATKDKMASACSTSGVQYNDIINTKFRSDYYSSFNNDLLELRTFSSSLRQQIINIIGVIKAMYAKK